MGRVSLTAAGRGVLGGSIVVYVCGVVLGWSELVVVAAGGLVAVLLGTVLVARRPRVEVQRRLEPDRVVAGATAQALLTVTNAGRSVAPPFTAVDRAGGARLAVPVPALRPGTTARSPYEIPTSVRGRLPLGPVVVTRLDPLGLVRRRDDHAAAGTLWVHPRTVAVRALPNGRTLEVEGPLVEGAPRGAMTFASLREYVPGDDVRQIHWRSTARAGTLIVRDHVDTSLPRTTVALDGRAEMWAPDRGAAFEWIAFESAVSMAASVAVAAQRAGDPVTLVVDVDPAEHEAARPASVLDELTLVHPLATADRRGFPSVLDRLSVGPGGGALVLVTGGADGATASRAASLRRRFTAVVLVEVVPGATTGVQRRSGVVFVRAGDLPALASTWDRAVAR